MERNTKEIPKYEEVNEVSYEELPVRRKKRRKKKHYLLRLFVLLLIIGGGIFVMSRPYFDIDEIKVEGNSITETAQVIKEAQIEKGDNIFALNKRQVKKRMGENPYYKEIDINKNLPNEVVITVKERTPAAVIPYGEKFVMLDETGIVLELTEQNPKLTEISGITIKNMDRGTVLEPKEQEVFEKALTVLTTATESDVFYKTIEIKDDKAICYVYDNLSVKGKYDEVISNMKNGNVKKILYDLYQKKIQRGTVKIDGDKYCSFTPTFE